MRIRGANNLRQKRQGRIFQLIFLQDRVERNFFAVMPQLASWDIVDNPVLDASPGSVVRKENELGVGVYKLFNDPRTCDPVDLYSFPSNPFHVELVSGGLAGLGVTFAQFI